MSTEMSKLFDEASPPVRALARETRALIHSVMPDIVEVPWAKQRIVGCGVGPKKMSEHFCYIALLKAHVNLGFNYGSELPDPKNLLEGTGKLMRHVKIRESSDIENPAVRRLLVAASAHRMPKR